MTVYCKKCWRIPCVCSQGEKQMMKQSSPVSASAATEKAARDYEHGYNDGVEWAMTHGHAQCQQEPVAWRWNTRADQRWRVTINRPTPNDRTAFDKIEPLYAALSDTSTDRER